ncbi:hypothetical protein KFL_013840010 [Klebsormidium nitens]|uniref:Uncharacterized protein n=1 Tax=Klebsormidium nitens TaxID=105231 RepID=A0A1Y1IRD4_KLENI|nr:hypothetical protein KFL_013840010 [Klebsormidium nitens]|eukprot:GAQ93244.1 hypothetical protein KFL_013840010 [Klebsormidium nitens]
MDSEELVTVGPNPDQEVNRGRSGKCGEVVEMPIDQWRAQAAETYGTALIRGFLKNKKRKLPEPTAIATRYKLVGPKPTPPEGMGELAPPRSKLLGSMLRRAPTAAAVELAVEEAVPEPEPEREPEPEAEGAEQTEEEISAGALLQLRREQAAKDPWAGDEDELEDDGWLEEALELERYPLRNRRGRAATQKPGKGEGERGGGAGPRRPKCGTS